MKLGNYIILFVICIVLPDFSEAVGPYSVACTSTKTAVISIDQTHYNIFAPKTCLPTNQLGGNYTFNCLGIQNHFLVSPILQKGNLRGGKGSKAFTISCVMKPDSSGSLVVLYTNVSVVEKFEQDNFGAPLLGIELLITSEDPSKASQPVTQMTKAADIGQKLFLVIQSDQSIGEDVFLPINCDAISEPPLPLTANLWSNRSTTCVEDDNLIERFVVYNVGRQYGSSGSKYNLAYAPIYTFFLNDKETESVVYTCTVMVCPSVSAANSTCGKTMETMTTTKNCLQVKNTASRRRRRAVDSAGVTGESTRTLSAKLRINLPSKFPLVYIVGGAVGAVVLLVLVNIVAIFLYRRRNKKRKEEKPGKELEHRN